MEFTNKINYKFTKNLDKVYLCIICKYLAHEEAPKLIEETRLIMPSKRAELRGKIPIGALLLMIREKN
jgi:hypothetical protein